MIVCISVWWWSPGIILSLFQKVSELLRADDDTWFHRQMETAQREPSTCLRSLVFWPGWIMFAFMCNFIELFAFFININSFLKKKIGRKLLRGGQTSSRSYLRKNFICDFLTKTHYQIEEMIRTTRITFTMMKQVYKKRKSSKQICTGTVHRWKRLTAPPRETEEHSLYTSREYINFVF